MHKIISVKTVISKKFISYICISIRRVTDRVALTAFILSVFISLNLLQILMQSLQMLIGFLMQPCLLWIRSILLTIENKMQ